MAEVEVPSDYLVKTGDVIRQILRGENTGILPLDDDTVISAMYTPSNKQIEDEIYKQTGVRVKVLNRKAEVVTPGRVYRKTIDYRVEEASSPTLMILATIIVGVLGTVVVLYALDWFLEKNFKLEVPGEGQVNLAGIFLLLAVILLIIALLKK